jgi:hypothetical protein
MVSPALAALVEELLAQGKLGDVHVSTVVCKVGRGPFERLEQEGWRP